MSARVAFVTGGAQGIGRATCERLLGDGWSVAIADLDPEATADCASDLLSRGILASRVFEVVTDVRDELAVLRALTATVERWGQLDAVVNNAGISRFAPLETLPLAAWHEVLETNLTGAFLVAKHAAPHLRRQRGAVVNIASTRALMSEPNGEAYAASKGGLVALTHALAVSLGPDVRVNCISPGWIDVSAWRKPSARQPTELTPADHAQHPAGRVGVPEDIANAIAWLLSPDNGFLTGAHLVLDGGMTRRMIYV